MNEGYLVPTIVQSVVRTRVFHCTLQRKSANESVKFSFPTAHCIVLFSTSLEPNSHFGCFQCTRAASCDSGCLCVYHLCVSTVCVRMACHPRDCACLFCLLGLFFHFSCFPFFFTHSLTHSLTQSAVQLRNTFSW